MFRPGAMARFSAFPRTDAQSNGSKAWESQRVGHLTATRIYMLAIAVEQSSKSVRRAKFLFLRRSSPPWQRTIWPFIPAESFTPPDRPRPALTVYIGFHRAAM